MLRIRSGVIGQTYRWVRSLTPAGRCPSVAQRGPLAKTYAIGIDADAFGAMARTPEAEERIRLMRRGGAIKHHIIGVERLDYSKGLPDRFRAYERFLEACVDCPQRANGLKSQTNQRLACEATLEIDSRPFKATVSVDGKDRGPAPVRLTVSEGPHLVEVRLLNDAQGKEGDRNLEGIRVWPRPSAARPPPGGSAPPSP